MERAEIGRISRQGFTDDPGGPSVLVLVERRRTRKQARTAASATDITRYRSAGGAICRLIRVIRWFGVSAQVDWFRWPSWYNRIWMEVFSPALLIARGR